jgi:[ribosomal protein S5]-alanine N-acetyltransferase
MKVVIPTDFTMLVPIGSTVKTARCILRCPSADDIPDIFAATRFVGFNDGMTWEAPINMDELYEPLRANLQAWEAGNAFVFSITATHSKILLGRIGIRKSAEINVWNLGFWTHPKYQRQGYMTDSAKSLLEFGFDRLGATRIEAGHALWNTASQRVLEKIGMKFIEYIPQGFQKQGQWIEENKMGITKEEWLLLSCRNKEQ